MKIGRLSSIEISDKIDGGGLLDFEMEADSQYLYDFIDKKGAEDLINHLKKVFELEG